MTPQKRRLHLIDKHMYPKNFFFAVTKDGIDGRRSLLSEGGHQRRRSSTSAAQVKQSRRRASTLEGETSPQAAKSNPPAELGAAKDDATAKADADMSELTGAFSALQFVPQSVRFGRGRAGFAKR